MLEERLKTLRESNEKSQLEVCTALNIEQSTLANYESGRRTPKIDILIKLAEYYNCSVDYLLGLENQKNDKANVNKILLVDSEMKKVLSDSYDELNLDNRYILIGEAKKLLKEQRQEEKREDLSFLDKSIEESIEHIDIEKKVEEAIRTQKGNLDTKIG